MYTASVSNNENDNRDIPADVHYLIIDTETTGVPENGYQDWSNCRLIQLGMVVKDRLFETVYESCSTVQLDGTNGTTEVAFNVHGISDISRVNATPSRLVCEEFLSVAERCDVLISHGNAFDFGVVFRECLLNNLDVSRLVGKTVVNTKQSEHYRGFSENLSQTVERISPNWCVQSDYLNDELHAHNALYDAHLCAELYRLSHHPAMNRPMQELIEYLNFRRYYDGLNDIRVRIENTRNNNEQPINNAFRVNERLMAHINAQREEDGDDDYIGGSDVDWSYDDDDERDNDSGFTWNEEECEEEEDQWTGGFAWNEEECEEEDQLIGFEEEDPYESEYAYENETYGDVQTTTEDYIRSMYMDNGRSFDYHAPEDYA